MHVLRRTSRAPMKAPRLVSVHPGARRGALVLASLLILAGIAGPALSAAPAGKASITKAAKRQIPKIGDRSFILESELIRYGPVSLDVGGSAPLLRSDPFTFTATCDSIDSNADGPPLEERGRILMQTDEAGTAVNTDDDLAESLPAGGFVVWAQTTAGTPGAADISTEDRGRGMASTPGGHRIAAFGTQILLNQGGSDCTFTGGILSLR